ncbi:hypothetical protein V8C86DRAFT_2878510 [Haematococcus lacustris]
MPLAAWMCLTLHSGCQSYARMTAHVRSGQLRACFKHAPRNNNSTTRRRDGNIEHIDAQESDAPQVGASSSSTPSTTKLLQALRQRHAGFNMPQMGKHELNTARRELHRSCMDLAKEQVVCGLSFG